VCRLSRGKGVATEGEGKRRKNHTEKKRGIVQNSNHPKGEGRDNKKKKKQKALEKGGRAPRG